MLRTCLALVLLASTAGVAAASDQIVNNCSNDTELRSDWNALQATGGGTLTFNCGLAAIVLTGGALTQATTSVVVDGGDLMTLSGGNASRIFVVSASQTLIVKNITLTLGYALDGGCLWSDGDVQLFHAIVASCHATNDGVQSRSSRTGRSSFSRTAISTTTQPCAIAVLFANSARFCSSRSRWSLITWRVGTPAPLAA